MTSGAPDDDRVEEAADDLLVRLGEPSTESTADGPEGGGRVAPGFGEESAHEGLHD